MRSTTLIIAVLLCASSANAQTYIRPSKGKSLTIVNSFSLNNPGFAPVSSPVYDWSAFSGVQMRMYVTKNGAPISDLLTDCQCLPTVTVKGAAVPTGPFIQEFDFNARTTFLVNSTSSLTYTVGNMSPYAQFQWEVENSSCVQPPDPARAGCSVNVTAVPFPTDSTVRVSAGGATAGLLIPTTAVSPVQIGGIVKKYGASGEASINNSVAPLRADRNTAIVTTAGASYGNNSDTFVAPINVTNLMPAVVYNVGDMLASSRLCLSFFPAAGYPFNDYCLQPSSVTVQNVGAVPAYCAFTNGNTAPLPVVTPLNFHFALGVGRERTFKNVMKPYTVIQCITAAGATDIAVMQF